MKIGSGNRLKTLLLILNESDLLEQKNADNLFARFSFLEREGVGHLIVYIDFLKTIPDEDKNKLIAAMKRSFREAAKLSHFPPNRFVAIASLNELPSALESESLAVSFIFGLSGREELKRILAEFIDACRKQNKVPADMSQAYISEHLALPPAPDLVMSHSKHTLTDFMLWQTVYSEYYFFGKDLSKLTDADFKKALESFYHRDRRYGV